MAESGQRPDRIASPATGRHSHRRRARSRRTGEKARAFSLGGLENRIARWITIIAGVGILLGQLALTWIFVPGHLLGGALMVAAVMVLSALATWIDQLRSKKRDPKPRWLHGILVAGFLSVSVVVGSLSVLTLSANPVDRSFGAGSSSVDGAHVDDKTMQLKLLAFHTIATVAGLVLLAHAAGPEKHRRSNSGRFKSVSAVPPA